MSNIFSDEAWEEYVDWQYKDKKMEKKKMKRLRNEPDL